MSEDGMLRLPVVQRALEHAMGVVLRNAEGREVPVQHVVEWAVGAALRYIADDKRGGPQPAPPAPPTAPGPPGAAAAVEARARAVAMGHTGDVCKDCGNVAMVRNGTCLKCTVCGATSGCS